MADDGLAIFEKEDDVRPARSGWQWAPVILVYAGVWTAIIAGVLAAAWGTVLLLGWVLNQYPYPL